MKGFTACLQLSVAVLLSSLQAFSETSGGAAIPEKLPLRTSTVRIGWTPGRYEPSTWEILAGKNGDSGSWHSIISRTRNGEPLSGHLSIRGFIHGEAITVGETGKAGILINEDIEQSDQPYCVTVHVTLQNTGSNRFLPIPSDDLWISLGPGIGQSVPNAASETPTASISSGAVACTDGKVETAGTDVSSAATAAWKSPHLSWAGIQDRYFAMLVLASGPPEARNSLPFTGTRVLSGPEGLPVVFFRLPLASLEPGMTTGWEFLVFSGPKSEAVLSAAPVNLDKLLFSGMWNWMRWICFGLMWLLTVIHMLIPGWGWSIIILALIVRILLYPLAKRALASQQKFVRAQKEMLPEMTEIKKNWKGGEQSERILQLYKKYNVSPFAGLKPLLIVLIQLPVLIALYQVLGAAYELRDAGFLWISSLAEPDRLFSFGFSIPLLGDHFNILPVLMALVTLLSFRLTPAPSADQSGKTTQNLFLIAMTVSFFLLFYSFPSGMVLYWTFANVFHILQQRMMMRKAT